MVCLITNSVQDVLASLDVNQLDFTSFWVNSSNLSCLTVCNSIEVGVVECTSIDVESASLHSCSKCRVIVLVSNWRCYIFADNLVEQRLLYYILRSDSIFCTVLSCNLDVLWYEIVLVHWSIEALNVLKQCRANATVNLRDVTTIVWVYNIEYNNVIVLTEPIVIVLVTECVSLGILVIDSCCQLDIYVRICRRNLVVSHVTYPSCQSYRCLVVQQLLNLVLIDFPTPCVVSCTVSVWSVKYATNWFLINLAFALVSELSKLLHEIYARTSLTILLCRYQICLVLMIEFVLRHLHILSKNIVVELLPCGLECLKHITWVVLNCLSTPQLVLVVVLSLS